MHSTQKRQDDNKCGFLTHDAHQVQTYSRPDLTISAFAIVFVSVLLCIPFILRSTRNIVQRKSNLLADIEKPH